MTKDERKQIRQAIEDNGGDAVRAACDFLGLSLEHKHAGGVPLGCEAAIGGIIEEVESVDDSETEVSAETSANLSRMNKSELLDVAQTVGAIGVSADSTKKEIIAAIEAA